MKKILIILTLFIFASCGKNPSLEGPIGSGGSPPPEAGQSSTTSLEPTNGDLFIKVLVFPHTLSSDGAHGKPDNKNRVTLESTNSFSIKFNGKELSTKNITFNLKSSMLSFAIGGTSYLSKSVEIAQSNTIKIIRENAPNKSHWYEGSFKVIARSASEVRVVNIVNLEAYLRGVVPSESPATWPMEALKSQTLAARSYAYYHLKMAPKSRDYHVDDTARYQVYTGTSKRSVSTDLAIASTAREVITHKGEVIVAYFHSYSGGYLEEAHTIFGGKKVGYTKRTQEIFSNEELKDEIPTGSQWIIQWGPKTLSKKSVMRKLKASSNTKTKFKNFSEDIDFDIEIDQIDSRNESGITFKITQEDQVAMVTRIHLRTAIGWSNILSYQFTVTSFNDDLNFTGYGWGHHVGMSQFGAYMMAKKYARNYKEILNHYYKDIRIEKY